ncbi:hypothetical protein GCM10009106_19610 [Sphingomonas japonica]
MQLFDLTPRQASRGLDILTGAVVVSIAFALAGLTWRIAGHAGSGAVLVPPGSLRPVAARPDLAPALALAPFGKAALSEAAQPTGLALVLQGIILANPATLSVAYIAQDGEAPVAYAVGAQVAGATIETIQRDRVLINNGGRIESLAAPDPFADPNAPAPAVAAAPVASQPAVAPQNNPPPSAQSIIARLDASPTRGGYAIGENAPPGLQPGDVIQSVNGAALNDAAGAQAAFEAASRSGSARIQILRNGESQSLTLPTR